MRKPTTVNLLCVFQYLSHFLPVQWNNYVFKCQWSLTDLSHRELQGINNDSGIVKTSPYKCFHFFFSTINLWWPVLVSFFIFFSLPGTSVPKAAQQLCGLLKLAAAGRTWRQSVCYWKPPSPLVLFVSSSSGWLVKPLSSQAMFQ